MDQQNKNSSVLGNLLEILSIRSAANRDALAKRQEQNKVADKVTTSVREATEITLANRRATYLESQQKKDPTPALLRNKLKVVTIDISNGAGDTASQPVPTDWTYITGISQNPDGTWNYARITWRKSFSITFAASYNSGIAESLIPSNYEEFKFFSDTDLAVYGDGFRQQYGPTGKVYFYKAITQQITSGSVIRVPLAEYNNYLGIYVATDIVSSYVDRNPVNLPSNYVDKGTYAIDRDNLYSTLISVRPQLFTANIINLVNYSAYKNDYILSQPGGSGYAFAEIYAAPPSISIRSSTYKDVADIGAEDVYTQEVTDFLNKPNTYLMTYIGGSTGDMDQVTLITMRSSQSLNYTDFMTKVLSKRVRLVTLDYNASLLLPVFLNKNKSTSAEVRTTLVDSYAVYHQRQVDGTVYTPNTQPFLGDDWESYVNLPPDLTIEQLRSAYATTLKATDFVSL